MLEHFRKQNPGKTILPVTDPAFCRFGRVLTEWDMAPLTAFADDYLKVPSSGTVYVPSDPVLEAHPTIQSLLMPFFSGLPYQVGYCNGFARRIVAMEYHRSSEFDLAVTDTLMILGDVRDVSANYQFNTKDSVVFYLPKGTAVELYSTTLHYAPSEVHPTGFKVVCALPRTTNTPLPDGALATAQAATGEHRLLAMINKYVFAAPGSDEARQGMYVGITGEDYVVKG
nr:DUF4867 family protein [bacterium]